jgi:hypothetical protein
MPVRTWDITIGQGSNTSKAVVDGHDISKDICEIQCTVRAGELSTIQVTPVNGKSQARITGMLPDARVVVNCAEKEAEFKRRIAKAKAEFDAKLREAIAEVHRERDIRESELSGDPVDVVETRRNLKLRLAEERYNMLVSY